MNSPTVTIPYRAFWNPRGELPKPPQSKLRQHQREHIEKTLQQGDIGLVRRIEEGRRKR